MCRSFEQKTFVRHRCIPLTSGECSTRRRGARYECSFSGQCESLECSQFPYYREINQRSQPTAPEPVEIDPARVRFSTIKLSVIHWLRTGSVYHGLFALHSRYRKKSKGVESGLLAGYRPSPSVNGTRSGNISHQDVRAFLRGVGRCSVLHEGKSSTNL